MSKPAKHCDECEHFTMHRAQVAKEVCSLGHKPRFYQPHWLSQDSVGSWKRSCDDFRPNDPKMTNKQSKATPVGTLTINATKSGKRIDYTLTDQALELGPGKHNLYTDSRSVAYLAAERDELLQVSLDFIQELTGMTPPPIKTAPPEVFAPFFDFVDRVQAVVGRRQ